MSDTFEVHGEGGYQKISTIHKATGHALLQPDYAGRANKLMGITTADETIPLDEKNTVLAQAGLRSLLSAIAFIPRRPARKDHHHRRHRKEYKAAILMSKVTISRAEVIACTLSTAATPIIANSYAFAEGLIVDEAARVPETMMWPIMEKYITLNWKVLVGDPYQLPPVGVQLEHYDLTSLLLGDGYDGWLNGDLIYAILTLMAVDHHVVAPNAFDFWMEEIILTACLMCPGTSQALLYRYIG
jgi:hypothetical protein